MKWGEGESKQGRKIEEIEEKKEKLNMKREIEKGRIGKETKEITKKRKK